MDFAIEYRTIGININQAPPPSIKKDSEKMQGISKEFLKKEFVSEGNEEDVDTEIRNAIDYIFELRIGSAVVYALSKRKIWKFEDQEKAWSNESLSIVADQWQDDLDKARKILSKALRKLSA